ncbi:MAG: hypothetical protein JEZ08_22485 [Clostridiales bacterium]|nr:hypothetical protein [Clostridiales bacterium]
MKKFVVLLLVVLLIGSTGAFAETEDVLNPEVTDDEVELFAMGPCAINGTHEAYPKGETYIHVHDDDNWFLHSDKICMWAWGYRCTHCGSLLYIDQYNSNRYFMQDGYHADSTVTTVWNAGIYAIKTKISSDTWRDYGWTFLQD